VKNALHLEPSAAEELPTLVKTHLASLTDKLSDAIMLMDEEFRILYANPKALEISQITSANFNRETLWELYPGVLESPLGQAYLEAVATREVRDIHDFYYEPLKTSFDLRIFPMDFGVGVHYRDVTALHRARNHQRALEDRIRNTLAAANGLAEFTRNIHPEDIGDTSDRIAEAMRTGAFAAQYRILQPDGASRWVDARATITFDEDRQPVRFSGIVLDITEQKETEEALRISEARYRALTELSPQSQWTATPEGLVVYANRRFLEYIGHDFVPKTGTEYIECFDPLDRAELLRVWTHSVTTGEDYYFEGRLIRASDRESRWWCLRATPVRGEDGVITQWLGTATDIHESYTSNRRLREQYAEIDRQRRELEGIYRGSPIGMALYEPAGLRLTRINDRQAEIFRLPANEAIGKSYDELAAGVPVALALIRRAAAGEPILNHDLEGALDRSPDEYRHWNINYSPILAEDGTVQAIASATFETTHLKRAEKALIQNEKLAAVGRMASSIAHEINNPLESITNLIYISRQHAIAPEVKTYLDLADQELRRVSIIANQTLRFHKQATNPREITCTDLFSTVLSLYEGRLKNSNISVERRKRATRAVSCFEGDIRQVLNNLVGNSIDAMSLGARQSAGRLLLRSRESTDWATGVRGLTLTVADTGTGIGPDAQAHLFEAFFTTKGINGTGLGLWISAEIMGRHHGHIKFRSSQNPSRHGTVFTLFLPFESPVEEREPNATTD
jgi:PAS domain S-box-containing protein